ncbi:DUF2786 domain-containing protein [Micromonospora sp. WMMD987]|uniref:DUF2786 domain-containing protein n=1 Tax=Micromonospora sp. WMMD987 TaxID=3016089 RepID=UPI002499E8C2|nr:DUF2786 domain-containing protein [Micromonospora sp. WMMD987]WFE96059.1 DUF2786 domain-containing protein [Micromonospora sp. WMMD987]
MDADALVTAAVAAVRGTDVRDAERKLDLLVVGGGPARVRDDGRPDTADGPAAVDAALRGRLVTALNRLWPRGWQPTDVARIVTRRLGVRPGRLLADALAVDRAAQPGPVPQWWDDQLADLDVRLRADDDTGWLVGWAGREGVDRITAVRDAVEVLALLAGLPPVAVLRPPPGGSGGATGSGPSGSRVLDRVRALLAKAESTTFPAEAEAFTGKAQELIARHSLERALVEADAAHPDRPGGIRIGTDAPYAGAKALLVQEVATANRCESVWSDDLGFATVLGFPADLAAVELLHTSLLVQATAAMLRGRRERRGGGRRTRAYDEAFLHAFAQRIGERLRAAAEEANRQATAAAGPDRLLPVLAARSDAVRERMDTLFPGVTRARLNVRDAEGWQSGTSAADRASLAGDAPANRPLPGRR